MSKYSSKKVQDEKWGEFDSTTEWKYWFVLLEKQKNGEISNLERQKEFLLVPSFKDTYGATVRKMVYKSDYTYMKDGKLHIIDVKGSLFNITNESKVKIKMCKYFNQDAIFEIIVTYDGKWFNLENKEEKLSYKKLVELKKAEKKAKKEAKDKLKADKVSKKKSTSKKVK